MAGLRIERRPAPLWTRSFIPVLAVAITFGLTSFLILWAGANPFEAYYHFLVSPLSSRVSALEVLVKSTPLIFTGIAVAFAFTAGYWNIGAEGQLLAGAIAAAGRGMAL
jgi:simple sugar transport system permease protein